MASELISFHAESLHPLKELRKLYGYGVNVSKLYAAIYSVVVI